MHLLRNVRSAWKRSRSQRTEVHLVDDLDGKEMPAGKGETVLFALDGTSFEIDLVAKIAAALRKTLAAYLAGARPAKPRDP